MQRTTLLLEDPIYLRIREESKRMGKSIKDTVNELLRSALSKFATKKTKHKFKIPVCYSKPIPGIDISNRDQLYDIFDKDLKL